MTQALDWLNGLHFCHKLTISPPIILLAFLRLKIEITEINLLRWIDEYSFLSLSKVVSCPKYLKSQQCLNSIGTKKINKDNFNKSWNGIKHYRIPNYMFQYKTIRMLSSPTILLSWNLKCNIIKIKSLWRIHEYSLLEYKQNYTLDNLKSLKVSEYYRDYKKLTLAWK